MPIKDTKNDYEVKAAETFDPIIKFIEENPNECKSDGYNFCVGNTYEFWIANGWGEHFRAVSRYQYTSIPPEMFTETQCARFQIVYQKWLQQHYKAPEIKIA
jgi:hypothetical protein